MAKSDWVKLLISILFTVGLGGISGVVTVQEIPHWYAGLHKPSFNPPNSLFGPVWSILYLLMGIGAWLVWKQPASSNRNQALLLFLLQFILNFCWAFIFFGMHQLGWALAELMLMWLAILLTIFQFGKFSSLASWLLVPYISWVSFAGILNAAIWKLNT